MAMNSYRMSFFESLCFFFRRRRRLSEHSFYFIFLLLGIGVLVPWNAFISAVPYFEGRICSIPGASEHFESWVALIFNLSSVGALSLLLSWPWWKRKYFRGGHRIPGTDERTEEISIHAVVPLEEDPTQPQPQLRQQSSPHNNKNHSYWFVTFPLALFLLVFVVTDCMVAIKDLSARLFLSLTLLGMSICGAGVAFATAGIVATSGNFPVNLGITPFVSGQAMGGVVVSAGNLFAAAAEDPEDYWIQHCNATTDASTTTIHTAAATCPSYEKLDTAVFLYFFVGAVVLLSCIIGFAVLNQSQEYETVLSAREITTTTEEEDEEFRDEQSPRDGLELRISHQQEGEESSGPDGLMRRLPSQTSVTSEAPTHIFQAIQGPAFCIFFTFLVTLALFPSWTSRMRSVRQCQSHSSRLSNDLYVPFTFVLFNVGDLGGRLLAGMLDVTQIRKCSTKLVLAALFRCLFFPLLLLCVGGNDPNRVQIHSDMYSLLVQALFALSNGFLISLGFSQAPNLIPNTSEAQEQSSELLTLSLSLGLAGGAALGARIGFG